MIYGLNFNRTQIPETIKRRFARTTRIALPESYRTRRNQTHSRAYLAGVATDSASRDAMLIQAQNGHRLLHVVERKTAGAAFYGIYVY